MSGKRLHAAAGRSRFIGDTPELVVCDAPIAFSAVAPLLREPGTLLRSTLAYLRYGAPLVISWSSRVRLEAGARLALGGRLHVGRFVTQIGQLGHFGAFLGLGTGSCLRTTGVVAIGPGGRAVLGRGAEVVIGGGTYLTADVGLYATQKISIGEGCAIGCGVTVLDSDGHALSGRRPRASGSVPVVIGDRVWIGAGATILKGAMIGEGAVVAACAVIRGEVPPGALVAGNPARVVDEDVRWGAEAAHDSRGSVPDFLAQEALRELLARRHMRALRRVFERASNSSEEPKSEE